MLFKSFSSEIDKKVHRSLVNVWFAHTFAPKYCPTKWCLDCYGFSFISWFDIQLMKKTSGMPAPISTLMASALISASFKPFKRLKCCNPRYFWGGILNFYTQMMNAPFASNILLLTMLEILKSTSWTMMLSLDP